MEPRSGGHATALVLIFVFALALLLAGAASWVYQLYVGLPPPGDHGGWGAMGDFFGGILNPLFGLLSLLCLILALVLQIQELTATRRELAVSAQALQDQYAAMKEQQKVLERQAFDQTFVNVLAHFRRVVEMLEGKGSAAQGGLAIDPYRDPFKIMLIDLGKQYKTVRELSKSAPANDKEENLAQLVRMAYVPFYDKHEAFLARYLKMLHASIETISKSPPEAKSDYCSILRANFSPYEHVLIFYHGVSEKPPNLRQRIIDYHLLQDLPFDKLLVRDPHDRLYPPEAYGTSVAERS